MRACGFSLFSREDRDRVLMWLVRGWAIDSGWGYVEGVYSEG